MCPGGTGLGIKSHVLPGQRSHLSRGSAAHTGREEQEETKAQGHSEGCSRRMHMTGRP